MYAQNFFPNNYFPSTFFAPGVLTSVGPGLPAVHRDFEAFQAIIRALQATGAFAKVQFDPFGEGLVFIDGHCPLAVISPIEWIDLDKEINLTRLIRYEIAIKVYSESSIDRYNRLGWASMLAHDAIANLDFGIGCLQNLNRLKLGRLEKTKNSFIGIMKIYGEFYYLY